uniref:cytochrome b n=1 Tax=Thaumasiovibrio occultus TaxID=1891184 RepID=UPI000B358BFC|nr:cytochrome b [Thaumasiovibrio occultus]
MYNLPARLFHWVSALTVFALFGVGLWMVGLDYYSSWYRTAPHWHKSVGLLLALLTLLRMAWKMLKPHPAIEGKRWEVIAAKSAHHTMYLLLAVMFISGYLISTSDGRAIAVFNWFEIPGAGELFPQQSDLAGKAHYYSAWLLIVLAGVHALAALKHHFIDKDNTLLKMLGVTKR